MRLSIRKGSFGFCCLEVRFLGLNSNQNWVHAGDITFCCFRVRTEAGMKRNFLGTDEDTIGVENV